MKQISLWLVVFALSASGVHAQDAATQQQLDKLSGQVQDMLATEDAQDKRLAALEHDVAELRDKVNAPAANNYASADDLQKLAVQLREIDQKRQDDRELILGKIEELAKISAAPSHSHHFAPEPKDTGDATPTAPAEPATPQTGFEYKVQAGDSLSAIIKAFRAKGVKTSLTQVLKANPGLNANTLYVGKTIFIPGAAPK